jgi:hypothetical protein
MKKKMKLINKIVINNRIYGIFNLIDFFDFKKGSGKASEDGNYPQLSSAKLNNGISGRSNSWIAENCFSIATTGSAGWCFWHPYKLDATSNACIATPKFKVGDDITMKSLAVYITSYLTYKRFFYGRVPSLCKLKKQTIVLPIINDDIDWEFIYKSYLEESINALNDKINEINNKIEKVKEWNTGFISPKFNPEIIKKMVINNRIYGLFNLTSFFKIIKGIAKKNEEGDFPLITAASKNNGIGGQTSTYTYNNCFTISGNGACGDCFWHPYKFDVNADSSAAIPKFKVGDDITMKGLATYISAYLKYKRFFYARKSGLSRLEKQIIALPVINDDIDWQFIHDSYLEETINVLEEEKERINKKIENIKKINVGFKAPEFN